MESLQTIGIQTGHRIALFALSLVFLAFVLELVRRDRLKEKYALLWLGTAFAGLVVGIVPGVITWTAALFHFQILTALFVFAFLFILGVVLVFSVILSRLSEQNRKLAQEVALLNRRIDSTTAPSNDDTSKSDE